MTIFLVGGGSGGHLTPLVAVAEALKSSDSSIKVIHIGQKNEGLQDLVKNSKIDESYGISAGKFRRYHRESFFSRITDVKTLFYNVRDFFRFFVGIVQAWRLIGRLKPDSIFLKGGFVGVPVGIAARLRKIPYITHDSDAIPGLANRLSAGKAVYNTTALPTNNYPYNQSKSIQVGIPLQPEYKIVSEKDKLRYKKNLDLNPSHPVVIVVGGGLGAQKVNRGVVQASHQILEDIPNITLIHLTGKKLYEETKELYLKALTKKGFRQVKLIDFSTELYKLTSAADLIISRAGATNMAEFAAQAKACIVIPNPVLTGGQQLRNADIYKKNNAAIIMDEDRLEGLSDQVEHLLNNSDILKKLGIALNKLSVDNAAGKIADILVDIAK